MPRRRVIVCPHDPWGNDPDTATYCPKQYVVEVPVGPDHRLVWEEARRAPAS